MSTNQLQERDFLCILSLKLKGRFSNKQLFRKASMATSTKGKVEVWQDQQLASEYMQVPIKSTFPANKGN